MRKSILLCCIMAVVMLFSGCNSSNQEYITSYENRISEFETALDEKNSQIAGLEAKNSSLESEIGSLESNVSNYKDQIDELENGAARLLSDALNAFEKKDYKKVIELAQKIHSKFNGSAEDSKAQEIASQSQAELDRIEAEAKAEEERKKAEAAKNLADKVHEIIQIHELKVEEINSAGGVDVRISWTNKSPKTIKYITFIVEPYNAVGDRVRCTIRDRDSARLYETGPIEQGGGSEWFAPASCWIGSTWEAVWYNNTVVTLKLVGVEIEYMDGTKEEIEDEELNYVFW